MRNFSDVQDDHVRAVIQAVENATTDLARARTTRQGHETARQRIEEARQEAIRKHRGLDSPQSALKSEIADLEARLHDLQRQAEAKHRQLQTLQAQADEHARDVRKTREDIEASNNRIQRANEECATAETALESAKNRLREGRVRALASYCTEAFGVLQRTALEATARQKYEALRAAYEQARTADPQVMAAHEERIELKRLMESAQVSAVRTLLGQRLEAAEQLISSRFPGILDGPPPSEDDEVVETFYWHDPDEDVTRLLVPVPGSCWHTPPSDVQDPRGQMLCEVLWALVGGLGDRVPTIDCSRDLVLLELHGDHSALIGDTLFETHLSGGRKVTFFPIPLSVELKEALL